MTDQTTETARALLYRHGLPEDVIDGALFLHAQELAAVQRAALPATVDRVANSPVNDMRELYALQRAIRDAGGELTRPVHKAIDALREVWDRELRRDAARLNGPLHAPRP